MSVWRIGSVLVLMLLLAGPALANPRHAAMVIDANTGDVLHGESADEPRHPASLAKMMTIYLAFEAIERGRVSYATRIKVSERAAEAPPTKLDLEEGDTIALGDAIKALITKSANDMAIAIAEHLGGSEAQFARLMTDKARQLGMTGTQYRNASGLPDVAQITTARDMLTLALRLYDDFPRHYPLFALRSFTYQGATHKNHNNLLGRFVGTDGIKTGYTRMSGFNLVSSVRRGGRHVMGVVLGGATADRRDDAMKLLLSRALMKASPVRRRAPRPVLVAERAGPRSAPAPEPVPRQSVAVAPLAPAPVPPAPRPARAPRPWRGAVDARQTGGEPGSWRSSPRQSRADLRAGGATRGGGRGAAAAAARARRGAGTGRRGRRLRGPDRRLRLGGGGPARAGDNAGQGAGPAGDISDARGRVPEGQPPTLSRALLGLRCAGRLVHMPGAAPAPDRLLRGQGRVAKPTAKDDGRADLCGRPTGRAAVAASARATMIGSHAFAGWYQECAARRSAAMLRRGGSDAMYNHTLALAAWCVVAMLPAGPAAGQDDLSARTAAVLARPAANPKLGHAITLRFSGLPGPVAALTGTADFEVANIACVAIDYERAPGGVRLVPRHRQSLEWTANGDGSYGAVVFEDAFVEENYFKLGLCRWQLQFVTVRFRSPATEFVAVAALEQVRAGGDIVQHYLVRDWSEKPAPMARVSGERAGHYLPAMGAQFTLIISMTSLSNVDQVRR